MDNNQTLLKFKVYDIDMGGWRSRHTKLKYAKASKKKLIEKHGLEEKNLLILYYTEKHLPHRYLSIARVHSSIFGY